jgi:hypothetical protein
MLPFATLTDKQGRQFSVNPELVHFVRQVDNSTDECLLIFGKDQVLRVHGTLAEITDCLREA